MSVDHESEGEGDDDGYHHVAGLQVGVGAVPAKRAGGRGICLFT